MFSASFWGLTLRGMLISYCRSGQLIGPTFKGQLVQENKMFLRYFALEDGTDKLPRNVSMELTFYAV